jgi:hypothetical protein
MKNSAALQPRREQCSNSKQTRKSRRGRPCTVYRMGLHGRGDMLAERKAILGSYQINAELMTATGRIIRSSSIAPCSEGNEVTEDVFRIRGIEVFDERRIVARYQSRYGRNHRQHLRPPEPSEQTLDRYAPGGIIQSGVLLWSLWNLRGKTLRGSTSPEKRGEGS